VQKKLSNCINFSNPWLRPLDHKHNKYINHEIQSPTNQMSNDEIRNKWIGPKDLKQKIYIIKRIRVKIKVKNKLEGNHKFSIGGLNWKENQL